MDKSEVYLRRTVRRFIIETINSNKMKILYIHGLGSTPEKEDTKSLKGAKIISPSFNYKSKTILFNSMCEIIEKEQIKAVIGHSFGGYFAYYLSEKYGIPSLLFAPSFDSEDRELQPQPKNIKSKNKDCIKIAILGLDDDVIIEKEKQIRELNKDNYNIFKEKIGHDIPKRIKVSYFEEFINLIK